ncbi:hypothetical protein BGW37DRAFT_309008 [Umbelopsis sp. PMI_123]|nr:hypothetical protein BGW37DRAFT_309008 [Umbelopsis sp. PMI_123]
MELFCCDEDCFCDGFLIDDSLTFTILFSLFMSIWSSIAFYAFYITVTSVDIALHRAPTNCTVVSAAPVSGNWAVHVTYPVPGQPESFTSLLDYTNADDIYTVNQTLSCFYSTHSFQSVAQYDKGVDIGTIIALLIESVMCLVAIAGALYIAALVATTIILLIYQIIYILTICALGIRDYFDCRTADAKNESTSSSQRTPIVTIVSYYLAIPAKYIQLVVGGILTWIQSRKSQQDDMYDMEEQATLISQGYPTEDDEEEEEEEDQTRHLLVYADRYDQVDQHYITPNSQ